MSNRNLYYFNKVKLFTLSALLIIALGISNNCLAINKSRFLNYQYNNNVILHQAKNYSTTGTFSYTNKNKKYYYLKVSKKYYNLYPLLIKSLKKKHQLQEIHCLESPQEPMGPHITIFYNKKLTKKQEQIFHDIKERPKFIKQSPHHCTVGRVDEVKAARELIVSN